MAKEDDLDWNDLRFFLRALEAKTLAGAARSMKVEHTTVGRRLSALERTLGASLVLRGQGGLRLTPLGAQVAPLVEEVERAVAAVHALVKAQRARVRLAVPSGFTALFASALPAFTGGHPELSLEIVSGAQRADLDRGEADAAVRIGRITDPALVTRSVGTAGSTLYASKRYVEQHGAPATCEDLDGHAVIGFDASLAELPAAKWLEQHASEATVVLRSREMTDMLAAAVGGVGIALLPCCFGDADPSLQRLRDEVLASSSLSLVYRAESRRSEPLRTVIRFVVDVMRENASRLRGDGASAATRAKDTAR